MLDHYPLVKAARLEQRDDLGIGYVYRVRLGRYIVEAGELAAVVPLGRILVLHDPALQVYRDQTVVIAARRH